MVNRLFRSPFFAVVLAAIAWAGLTTSAQAEVRTLSLFFPHTGESITVTYKKNGRYIPSAMKQLNWFFRDWRKNQPTKMDPETIDLLWELYSDLGARKPAHIVSGYRSPGTNAMLRRIGRKVARHSQHMRGKAIDVYFPDVPTSRLRGSALARRVGGVGYYPRSGSYGFVHIDSGSVRHWPRMSSSRLASVISRHRGTIGARRTRPGRTYTQFASKKGGPRNIIPGRKQLAQAVRPIPVPIPRPRPLAVAMAAAAADDRYIMPVSAPLEKRNFGTRPALVRDGIGTLLQSDSLNKNPQQLTQRSNRAAKGSFIRALRNGTARKVPYLKPMQASASGQFWWSGDVNDQIRRDGAPNNFSMGNQNLVVASKELSGEDKSALEKMIAALTGRAKAPVSGTNVVRKGKSDRLIVNRAAKGDMVSTRPLLRVKHPTGKRLMTKSDKMASSFEAILKSADKPLSFTE